MAAINFKMRSRQRAAALAAAFLLTWVCTTPAQAAGRELIPVGRAVGIHLETPGALVVGLSTENGGSPAGAAGLRPGDLITGINGQTIGSSEDFLAATEQLTGETVYLQLQREGQTLEIPVDPMATAAGWKLGLWLRSSISGIGTVTFIDPETGLYGALGHPINDVDTGMEMPLGQGSILQAEIVGVRRGECGNPGELCGSFDFGDGCGSIVGNNSCGIFGYVEGLDGGDSQPVEIGGEVRPGDAVILSNVQGRSVEQFRIHIDQVHKEARHALRFTVTDPALLQLTGGVVQGMSGSPILQDGKLVGAVTHVLVNDPTRGYGICIGEMLSAAEQLGE